MIAYDTQAAKAEFERLADELEEAARWVGFVAAIGTDANAEKAMPAKRKRQEPAGQGDFANGIRKGLEKVALTAERANDQETADRLRKSGAEIVSLSDGKHGEELADALSDNAAFLWAFSENVGKPPQPTMSDIRADIAEVKAATNQAVEVAKAACQGVADARHDLADNLGLLETTQAATNWLVHDRMKTAKQNKERGKSNQAKGDHEERECAARDMETALNRVHDRMKNGAKNVLAECRAVCNRFTPMGRKNEFGVYPDALPLTGAGGKPIEAETLAKNYRNRFGTKKANKAKRQR